MREANPAPAVLGAIRADRDGHEDERAQIRELLEAARDLWRALPEVEDEGEQRIVSRTTFRLVHLADILAVTSGA